MINSKLFSAGSSVFFARKNIAWLVLLLAICTLAASAQLSLLSASLYYAKADIVIFLLDAFANYFSDTFWLVFLTAILVSIFAIPTAWLTTQYAFLGRRLTVVLLVLPLAIPGYIAAYAYTELFGDAGIFPEYLKAFFGVEFVTYSKIIEIHSMSGAVWVLSSVLYPYLFICCRAAFLQNSGISYEVARSLGASARKVFMIVAVPGARPAIATGITLVAMETLNDFGLVQFFGLQTFSVGVYVEWLNRGSLENAVYLAIALQFLVLTSFALERIARGKRMYNTSSSNISVGGKLELKGMRAASAIFVCLLPVLFGLLIPVGVLLRSIIISYSHGGRNVIQNLFEVSYNSALISLVVVVILISIALFMSYTVRASDNWGVSVLARFAASGYTIPGVVLAIGVLIALRFIETSAEVVFGYDDLWLSGSIFALILAYVTRFMAVAYGTVHGGYSLISPNIDLAANNLNGRNWVLLSRIHVPILKPSLIAAAMLVAVDSIKELPMTLLLRPFGYENLATTTYTYATIGRFEIAATPALLIVIAGILPVILLERFWRKN